VNSLGTGTPWASYDAWRVGDTKLDWFGTQAGQGTYLGSSAFGTPLAWTTSNSTLPRTEQVILHIKENRPYVSYFIKIFSCRVLHDNRWKDHHHMVDFDMDCSETEGGWFDVKAYITNFGKLFVAILLPTLWPIDVKLSLA
jgi:alpha-amylase